MRSALAAAAQRRAGRSRSASLSSVPPAETSSDYLPHLAAIAASILYRSPLPSAQGRPIYILNAAAFPDAFEVDFDSLLSYVLARLPGEDELIAGTEYEIIFFAGGPPETSTSEKKQGPGMGWYLQAYHVLSRATRKKLQRLYIVHPRTWVRVLIGVFGTIVSPKFRRKIVHVNTLSQLALHIPIERLLIPPAVYLHDRKLSPDIDVPYASGRRAFGARHALPKDISTGVTRLPRVLRETTAFVLLPQNIVTEGLFRIPPNNTQAGVLREAYDRGQQFIIWKEREATVVQPGIDQTLVDEVRLEEAYGVHLAASLIKLWYRELREPIFPESSYEHLRQKYGSPEEVISPEDLVDLIMPASPNSPLSATNHEILTRHLLPLLSTVAAHEPGNKMNAENLAICFSMCMICGSNQLEDAKVASVIRRILHAAIDIWPQLREGLGIDAAAFELDLRPPADLRNYEDPLEADGHKRLSEDDAVETREGHRIVMENSEDIPEPTRAPTLPPRPRARAASAAKPLPQHLPGLDTTSPIKRKPAPAATAIESAPAAMDPPRYSSVFDAHGNSLDIEDSPTSYVPSNGIDPARRANNYDEDMKKGFDAEPEHPQPPLVLDVPKRKAVSGDQQADVKAAAPMSTTRSASEGGTLAKMAAQKAATAMAQRILPNQRSNDTSDAVVQSPESMLAEGDGVFRKPSWPASANQPNIQSLAKPVLPPRQSQTVPTPKSSGLTAPIMPKPRTPSPGLLQRMSSMEPANGTLKPTIEPKRLNLRKASVDDLRRLYEERYSTAESLKRAELIRRGSSQTS